MKTCHAARRSFLAAWTFAALFLSAASSQAQIPAGEASTPGFDPSALQAAAGSGDLAASFQLGTLDYVGIGVVQDYIGAAQQLSRAADAGNADAQWELGFLYQTGSFAQGPPPPNPAKAAPWYEKSAALGNPWGQFALAGLYLSGKGESQDPAKAAALFALAATQGVRVDPASFPLQQLQAQIYANAEKTTGQSNWSDLVSAQAGGGQ